MNILEARDLWKVYEHGPARVEAVRAVDLLVPEGELVAIMGPSGSGKTTLLTLLGAMLSPTKGVISIDGCSLSDLSQEGRSELRRAKIGFVFQSFNLFGALTARQNVEVALRLRGMTPQQGAIAAGEALERVGLGDRADFMPEDLSGGQKQRVSIARALAGGPRLILADEPTGSLDAQNGRSVMEILSRLSREFRASVVVVTHDQRMTSFVDRILRMEDGRLMAEARA